MCGISGIFSTRGSAVDLRRVETMAARMQHRGPDNTTCVVDGRIGLAHNRLSLLDLSERGNQPFQTARHLLVYNGEIYNFQALRDELQRDHDVSFSSGTDTEVLFHLLILEGVEATLAKIEGMFAFAFYDRETATLSLARDRIGIKPLFFHSGGAEVHFASELKALTSVLDLELDKARAVEGVLGYLEHTRRYSAFQGLRQVEPGTWVTFEASGDVRENKYFRTSDLVDRSFYEELDSLPEQEVYDLFDRTFQESVGKMLIADAPIGAFVSGGIDSSLISTAAKRCDKNPLLYTVNVVGKYSELEFAKVLSDSLDTPLNVYDFEPEMFIRDWVKTTYHNDSPVVINLHAVPFGNITRVACEKGDKAVLTGEGADELYLGYPLHVRTGLTRLIEAPQRLVDAFYRKTPLLNRAVPPPSMHDPHAALQAGLQQYEKQILLREYAEAYGFIEDEQQRGMQSLCLQLVDTTLYSLLWRNDRMGMMNSIESRFPFLDERMLEFGANLPMRYKVRKTARVSDIRHPFLIDKYIVRKSASRWLPSQLTRKRKQAFPIYGLEYVTIDPRIFEGGVWQDILELSTAQLRHMIDSTPSLMLNKIASMEVWGRLFVRGDGTQEVHEHLAKHCRIQPA